MAAIPISTSASRPSSPSAACSSNLPLAYPTLPGIDASSVEVRNFIICYLRKAYRYSPAEAETEAEKFRGDGIAFYRLDELDLKTMFGVAGQLMWDGIQRSHFGLYSHVWAYSNFLGSMAAAAGSGAAVASIYGNRTTLLVSIGGGFGVNVFLFLAHRISSSEC